MTNAVSSGVSHALSYDEDNRVISVHLSSTSGTTNIVNEYDALGRRVSRSLNGGKTRYVLHLTGNMERILCDINSDSTFTYYVHGPDLCYRVEPDGKLTCFHADAMANVIATTVVNQTVVSQYAYTAYGRLVGATNFQSQMVNPYLFVGAQGVMEELPGFYFMRARYYSADTGRFASSDPVKKIGPGWKAAEFTYGNDNPLTAIDPNGTLAIQVGRSIGAFATFIGGADASASFGLVLETDALFSWDWRNGIGFYGSHSEGGEFGFALGGGPSIQFEGGFQKSGRGVKSIQGGGWYAGTRGSFGGSTSLLMTGDEHGATGYSINIGARAGGGVSAVGGVGTTGVTSVGDIVDTAASLVGGLIQRLAPAPRVNSLPQTTQSTPSNASDRSLTGRAASAGIIGGGITVGTEKPPSKPSLSSGSTSGGTGGSSGQINLGFDAFAKMGNANSTPAVIRESNPATSQAKQAPEKSSTGIIQQIFNWFTGLFGGSSSSGSGGAKK